MLNESSHGDAPQCWWCHSIQFGSLRSVSPKRSRHHLTCPLWRRCGNRKWWDFQNKSSRDKVGTGHVICGLHIFCITDTLKNQCSEEKRHKRAARRQFGSCDDEFLLLRKQEHTKSYSFVPTLPAFIVATSCFTHRPVRRLVCFETPVKSELWRGRHHQLPVV